MRHLNTILLILALPAGVVGYMVGTWLISLVVLPSGVAGIAQLFVPLFVGGLCMVPFVAPAFDRMAKRDLAELERRRAAGQPDVDPKRAKRR